jgi:hypothetical protein
VLLFQCLFIWPVYIFFTNEYSLGAFRGLCIWFAPEPPKHIDPTLSFPVPYAGFAFTLQCILRVSPILGQSIGPIFFKMNKILPLSQEASRTNELED